MTKRAGVNGDFRTHVGRGAAPWWLKKPRQFGAVIPSVLAGRKRTRVWVTSVHCKASVTLH